MSLRMIRHGMLIGFGFLLAVAALEWLASRPGGAHVGPRAGGSDADITEAVWQVLAEARKILEESA